MPSQPAAPIRTAPPVSSAARPAAAPNPPPVKPLRPLSDVEIFQQAVALYHGLPEQPTALRREALELIALLGGGLTGGEPAGLISALQSGRQRIGRLQALATVLIPARLAPLEPHLIALHKSLGYFLRYLQSDARRQGGQQ